MMFKTKPRIIYNDDTCSLRFVDPPHTPDKIALAVDYLKNTQVDVLCWLVAEEIAYSYPSKVLENLYDIRKRHEGIVYDKVPSLDLMHGLHLQGVDYLPLLIQRARDQGLGFFASFRMNDTHLKSAPDGPLASEYWKTHQHYRLWEVLDGKTYYNAALDYSFPEVRRRKVEAVREVAENYDVDGIELDMCRNPYFFQPSEAWSKRHILTAFVAEVRDALRRIGRTKKKSIGLMVRIPFMEERLTRGGIDVEQWIVKKLMDVLVMSYLTNNHNQSLAPWRSLCRKNGILYCPSLETGPAFNNVNFSAVLANPLAPRHSYGVGAPIEDWLNMYRGLAQNYLAQGADGIYMFNYPCALFEGRNAAFWNSKPVFKRKVSILSEVGRPQTLRSKNKLFPFYLDLPLCVEANRPPKYHQTIRFNLFDKEVSRAKVTLRFRQRAEKNPHAYGAYRQNPLVPPNLVKYLLNGEEIPTGKIRRKKQPGGTIPSGFKLGTHEVIEIDASSRKIRNGENTFAFSIPRYPRARDPYVYIYEFEVDVKF